MWDWLRRYPVLRVVIVNLKSGSAFRGVLWRRRGGYLVLRNATALRAGSEPAALDGEVAVPSENVDFLQVVT